MNHVFDHASAFPGRLEHIVVLRHEEYGDLGYITAEGRMRLGVRAISLRGAGIVGPEETGAISSSEMRAMQSLRSFLRPLGLANTASGQMFFDELASDESRCDTQAALAVVARHAGFRSLVVFTHLELATRLPAAIGKALGFDVATPDPQWGEGVHIDVLRRRARFLCA